MTTKNKHNASFSQPISDVYAALTDAAFWDKVANRFSAAEGKVDKFETSDAGTTVVITQTVSKDRIPDQAQRFVKGAVSLTRTIQISPLTDAGATSTITTETSGVPVSFDATQKLSPAGGGTTLATDYSYGVKLPLVGSMVEGKAAPYVEKVIEAEVEVLRSSVEG